MVEQWLFLSCGAILGATARWLMGVYLNPIFNTFSVATLMVNLIGCFLIGIALALSLNDSLKLFCITGFLGSFTTFSAFSAEMVQKYLAQEYTQMLFILTAHTLGGILCTLLGFILVRYFLK